MKSAFVGFSLLFLAIATHDVQGGLSDVQKSIARDGEYIGRESMPNLTPEDPEATWFHENTLLIRNDDYLGQGANRRSQRKERILCL